MSDETKEARGQYWDLPFDCESWIKKRKLVDQYRFYCAFVPTAAPKMEVQHSIIFT